MARRRTPPTSSSAPTAHAAHAAHDGGAGDVVALRPYSIGTAARLAGLAPAVVRMWEVRYQFLEPDRTGGGHRLYSEDDVRVLRAVKTLLDTGLRIGAIARMPRESIVAEANRVQPPAPLPAMLLSDRDRLLAEIVDAARDLDGERVGALLDRPRLLVDGADVVLDLYLPLLVKVGDLWHQHALPVASEHFVEKLVTARLHAVLASTPSRASGRLALLACPPKERHEGGLLAAAILLKRAGFDVAVLGADLPVDELVQAAVKAEPAVIVLAVTLTPSPHVAHALVHALAHAPLARFPLVVGGRGAPDVAARVKHAVVCSDVRAIADDAQRALRSA